MLQVVLPGPPSLLLLIKGRRSRRSSAVHVVQQYQVYSSVVAPVITVFVFQLSPKINETHESTVRVCTRGQNVTAHSNVRAVF